ncbi:unnamed protein product [Parascedosporium putredinis]|uniref:Prokaryotic-type class I peptide chain release factors domain-containing protein n=1 Tax=Parascedosporium putredinis TaxID=1442378 RepID=A0A9P1GTP9_9PEZI|nr:unnamed protein product [Parascedosporium putredinis]CAI7987454.1 unnamed protein product [Parascedosporium putredinis]
MSRSGSGSGSPLRGPILPTHQTSNALLHHIYPLPKNPLPSRPKPPPEDEIEEVFVKGSGPGGQKLQNKTNSAVQIKHLPTGIVVKSQATRSRSENRAIARKVLAQRLDELYNGGESRTAIVGDLKRKKRASSDKKSRRKYRKLEEERQGDSISASLEEVGSDFVARDMACRNPTETEGQENLTRPSDEALKPTSVALGEAAKPTCPRE